MSICNALASVPVNDLQRASQWYERLFGRAADSKPMREVAEWKFERGGWLQVYQLPERAGKGSVTLVVSDIEEQIAELHKCGIETPPAMRNAQFNVVMIKDPDGNSIAFSQPIGGQPG